MTTTVEAAQMIGQSKANLFKCRHEGLQFPGTGRRGSRHEWGDQDIKSLRDYFADRRERQRQRREQRKKEREARQAKADRDYESVVAGVSEARVMLPLIGFNGHTVESIRRSIDVSEAEEVSLRKLRGDVAADIAIAHRRQILAAFDSLIEKYDGGRKLPKVKRPVFKTQNGYRREYQWGGAER